MFVRADFAAVAARLAAIAGSFILSVNDVPETREIFAAFSIETVGTRYTIAGGQWSDVSELIVTGPRLGGLPPPRDLLSL